MKVVVDVKAFLQENTILPCKYPSSSFIDKDYRHIVTGDIRIVGNNKLKKLFAKCSKYRENNNIQ